MRNQIHFKRLEDSTFKKMVEGKKTRNKGKGVRISRSQIHAATKAYLKNGGKIKKCKIPDKVAPGCYPAEVDYFLIGS